jgi:hypothetical protein
MIDFLLGMSFGGAIGYILGLEVMWRIHRQITEKR